MITATTNLGANFKLITIMFMFGICSYQFFWKIPPYIAYFILFLLVIFLVLNKYWLNYHFNKSINKKLSFFICYNLLSIICGYIYMLVNLQLFKHNSEITTVLEGKKITVAATVLKTNQIINNSYAAYPNATYPNADYLNAAYSKTYNFIKLDLTIDKVWCKDCNQSQLSKLKKFLIGGKIKASWFNPKTKILPGDQWMLLIQIIKPRNFKTIGSFDIEKQMFSQRIKMLGKIIKSTENKLIHQPKHSWTLNTIKYLFQEKIKDHFNTLPLKKNPYF